MGCNFVVYVREPAKLKKTLITFLIVHQKRDQLFFKEKPLITMANKRKKRLFSFKIAMSLRKDCYNFNQMMLHFFALQRIK